MTAIFSLFAKPLGYVLHWIYTLVPSYFVAIFLFTFIIRLILFPLSIKQQKGQTDRARLAPRLERLQKKYANDRQKMAQKQQELYEKEGVSMTGGCLPMILQMLVLFSIIAVIYRPLTFVQRMPSAQIETCVSAVKTELTKDMDENSSEYKKISNNFRSGSYYQELYLMQYLDGREGAVRTALIEAGSTQEEAAEAVALLQNTKNEFSVLGVSLLEVPNMRPSWLWLVAIMSGLAALLSSIISMRYSKATMPEAQQQMGGCSTNGMMYAMPVFSLVIAFTVPGGVALYWVFSNLLAVVQTVVLNHMYNPAKARAQAEAEYAERRRKKAEDKARLKAARLEEQAAWQREENEKRAAKQGKKPVKPAEKPEEPAEEPTDDAAAQEQPASTAEE